MTSPAVKPESVEPVADPAPQATVKKESAETTTNGDASATATATNGSVTPAPSGVATMEKRPPTSKKSDKNKTTKRCELEKLMREFQSKLGANWEKYHEALSYFLIGKLSRTELVATIGPLLRPDNLMRYHNKLLLTQLANSTKDCSPQDYVTATDDFALFWNKKAAKSSKVKSSQYEKFKQNIMGLPIKERLRIKNITRDSGKQGKLSAGITLTRHAMLPKIPMISDKDQQQLHVNSLVQWQQDVVNGINTPICTETYELPDYETLSKRVLMTMREYGLTGGVSAPVLEVILLGLESYLKSIMEKAIDVAKYRENKYINNDYIPPPGSAPAPVDVQQSPSKRRRIDEPKSSSKDITLCIEDMYNTLEMFPHLIEPGGAKYRLSGVMLHNDDSPSNAPDYQMPATRDPSSILEKEDNKEDKDRPSVPPRADAHVGNPDDLKWILHDLVSTM